MKVLVAMSGGVDSSVAAAVLRDAGHEVTGVTLKLWGGESDSGCCSVADVEDARRVAQQLDLPHYVFNLTGEFDARVVDPYVAAYAAGRTPNPCVECNRTVKWGLLLERCRTMGFDALATGHHARVARDVHHVSTSYTSHDTRTAHVSYAARDTCVRRTTRTVRARVVRPGGRTCDVRE